MDPQRTAMVTGGAGGIGAAICRVLAEAGHRVAVADLDEARAEGLAKEIGGVAIALDADTHVIFGGEDGVEQAIRALSGGGESVASTKWFARAKASIPSSVGLATLQNSAASGEFIWSALRKMKEPGQGGRAAAKVGLLPQGLSATGGADLFDFTLLPEFEAVKKYFGLSASYGIARQDGFFFEFKYLNPQ